MGSPQVQHYVQGVDMFTTSMLLLFSTMTAAKTGSSFNLFERKGVIALTEVPR